MLCFLYYGDLQAPGNQYTTLSVQFLISMLSYFTLYPTSPHAAQRRMGHASTLPNVGFGTPDIPFGSLQVFIPISPFSHIELLLYISRDRVVRLMAHSRYMMCARTSEFPLSSAYRGISLDYNAHVYRIVFPLFKQIEAEFKFLAFFSQKWVRKLES